MKIDLIQNFAQWLKEYSNVELMRSYEFAEYEIDVLLETEAPGEVICEDEYTFTALYDYDFTILPRHSTDNRLHSFCFAVKIIGIKGNVTASDSVSQSVSVLVFLFLS